jgi:hypothetical protein
MNLKPYKYNAVEINDGTNYFASMPGRKVYPGADAEWSERAWTDAKLAGKSFPGTTIKLVITIVGGSVDALAKLFDKYDRTPRILICKDANDSSRQWFVKAFATDIELDNKLATITLAVDEPREWQTVTTNSDSWAITATGQTHAFNPVIIGNRPCKPILAITPTSVRSGTTGYLYLVHVPIYSTSTNHAPDYPILLTQNGATVVWDHEAEVDANPARSLASGNDVRVLVNGNEVDYWATGFDSASCKLWTNLSFEPGQTMTLLTAIDDSANITTIVLKPTAANKKAMKELPAQNPIYDANDPNAEYVQLLIGDESFIAKNNNPNTYTFSGVTRAANDTVKAAHATNASVRWIQYDIKVVWGDLVADAPTIDDTKKPIIDLTNSTNASWVYTEFASSDYKRTGGWLPAVNQSLGKTSVFYTGSHQADADPATEMGMSILAYLYGGKWCAENAEVVWLFYHPFGMTAVTSSGAKNRASTGWATGKCGLYKSNDGIAYTAVNAETTPGSAWEAFSHNATSLSGTYHYLETIIKSTLLGTASNRIDLEYQGATLALTGYPTVAISARKDTYYLDVVITNNTTSESILLALPMLNNTALTVDCSTLTAKHADGRVANVSLSTIRHDWLNCGPGATTLLWTAVGTAAVTVGITWKDRNL